MPALSPSAPPSPAAARPAPAFAAWGARLRQAAGSFRWRLAAATGALALVALLSFGLYAGEAAIEARRAQSGEQLSAATRHAAELLSAMLQEREKEIVVFGRSALLRDAPLGSAAVRESLELRRAATGEYAWLGVAAPDGSVLNAAGGLLVGGQVGARPWFAEGRRHPFTGDVHEALLLAKLLPAQAAGEPLRFIDIAAPIHDADGALRGVLGAHIHWSWVTATIRGALEQAGAGGAVEAFIVARDGSVLYPPSAVGDTMLQGLPDGVTVIRRRGDHAGYLVSQWAVPATRQSDLGWRIVLRQPLAVALAPAQALRQRLLAAGLLASFALAVMAYALAVRLSRPLEQLSRTARRVRDGEAVGADDYPRRAGSTETDTLSRTVQQMTDTLLARGAELQRLNATLEEAVARRTAELVGANLALARLASEDGLTGVANRRSFDRRLHDELARSRRSGRGFGLLLVDADHFKAINDRHGHPAGDAVLVTLAGLLKEGTRGTDLVARYGGEEFALLLTEIRQRDDALHVAEKIRAAVADRGFDGGVGRVTVSVGVAWVEPEDVSPAAALQRADAALYRAKAEGRDRCVAAWDPTAPSA